MCKILPTLAVSFDHRPVKLTVFSPRTSEMIKPRRKRQTIPNLRMVTTEAASIFFAEETLRLAMDHLGWNGRLCDRYRDKHKTLATAKKAIINEVIYFSTVLGYDFNDWKLLVKSNIIVKAINIAHNTN